MSNIAADFCDNVANSNEQTFEIAKRLRQQAVAVRWAKEASSSVDEVFTMKDGSEILWDDSGFNVF